jgi:aldehyde dehydrogenase (NAD+)
MLGRPAGLRHGFFIKPTIFSNVSPSMRIAREEIFGPVLSILPYDNLEQAIEIANGTEFCLSSWVYSSDFEAARRVARRIRAGRVYLNGAPPDPMAPFGGYKRSGNGREGGIFGLEAHLEIKAILGYR